MFRSVFWYGLCVCALLLTACGSKGPTTPSGDPLAILAFFDRGTAGMAPEKIQQVDQLANWMEPDLIRILNNYGYAATQVNDPNTPVGPGRYLLRVRIVEYNAGSKAARMFVGYGAGAARLDTAFELIGPDGSVYASGAPSVASGRDWNYAARKVNEQTVTSVTARLRQGL
jgi:hypothetical protein